MRSSLEKARGYDFRRYEFSITSLLTGRVLIKAKLELKQ